MSCSFVADAMLGTLAKWLRILGYDTVFDAALDDHQLARLALAQDRVLLTRDRALAKRRGVRTLLIESEQLDDQIRQVLADLQLEPDRSFSRCPVCNELLDPLDREAARERVPAYVAKTHKNFRLCPGCGRVYWRGSHWHQMDEHLAQLHEQDNPPGA
ncbi:MAG: Mut7-C RNAse domain-containing protein [Anaerolineae bacterium]